MFCTQYKSARHPKALGYSLHTERHIMYLAHTAVDWPHGLATPAGNTHSVNYSISEELIQ